jgi:NADPH-dependent 2,4-dienoyl-CoA reductase/sulfur reductase-like enzyme
MSEDTGRIDQEHATRPRIQRQNGEIRQPIALRFRTIPHRRGGTSHWLPTSRPTSRRRRFAGFPSLRFGLRGVVLEEIAVGEFAVADVLVVGAGPVGLTLACELARHGVRCRIIDKLVTPLPYCRAIGAIASPWSRPAN